MMLVLPVMPMMIVMMFFVMIAMMTFMLTIVMIMIPGCMGCPSTEPAHTTFQQCPGGPGFIRHRNVIKICVIKIQL